MKLCISNIGLQGNLKWVRVERDPLQMEPLTTEDQQASVYPPDVLVSFTTTYERKNLKHTTLSILQVNGVRRLVGPLPDKISCLHLLSWCINCKISEGTELERQEGTEKAERSLKMESSTQTRRDSLGMPAFFILLGFLLVFERKDPL